VRICEPGAHVDVTAKAWRVAAVRLVHHVQLENGE
jgi:hypothetical protein